MPQGTMRSNHIELLNEVSKVLEEARQKTVREINTVMIETYWQIGRLILEEEQRGKERAEYGEELIKRLSNDLTKKFGRGFTAANLWNMRQFYSTYPTLYAARRESETWERLLYLRVKKMLTCKTLLYDDMHDQNLNKNI